MLRFVFVCLLLLAAPFDAAFAQSCDLPNILILIDASGTMNQGSPTLWSQAMSGIDAALGATPQGASTANQNLANWGLAVFPQPFDGVRGDGTGYCWVSTDGSGAITLLADFAPGNQSNIFNQLTAVGSSFSQPFESGYDFSSQNDTPIYQALNDTTFLQTLPDYILLITDGQQDCAPRPDMDPSDPLQQEGDFNSIADGYYDGSGEHFDTTQAYLQESQDNVQAVAGMAQRLLQMNVQVYPIGFNVSAALHGAHGPATLNGIATSAGTQIPGCNAQETDGMAADNCYPFASNQSDLDQAIEQIVLQINAGACWASGVNIPGCLAEGAAVCSCQMGQSECVAASSANFVAQCLDAGTHAPVTAPLADVCNGKDDDCDGFYDNVPGTTENGTLTQACGTGACAGTQVCNAAPGSGVQSWSTTCVPQSPSAGECNCQPGTPCNAPSPGCLAEGAKCRCQTGEQRCIGAGYGSCTGTGGGPVPSPEAEACNGIDDDCDGIVDNAQGSTTPYSATAPCMTACGPGTYACLNGVLSKTCVPNVIPPERCDGLDDQCNGQIDPSPPCACKMGETRPCGSSSKGCTPGIQKCEYGQWTVCLGGSQPSVEVCNGLDDNCDGMIDNNAACPGGKVCVCGSCEPYCDDNGSCSNGGSCDTQGACQIDYCQDSICNGSGQCGNNVPSTAPQSSSSAAPAPAAPAASPIKTVQSSGCHDHEPLPVVLAVLLVVALPRLRFRTQRRVGSARADKGEAR